LVAAEDFLSLRHNCGSPTRVSVPGCFSVSTPRWRLRLAPAKEFDMINRRTALSMALASTVWVLFGADAQAQTAAPAIQHGALKIEAAWMREPPGGARVAGGYLRITNTGTASDRLVSGSAPFAGRLELHEMAMVNNVMQMRELAAGIEIKPGQTIELKPGGLHLMYMDLKDAPKAGETRKTTLVFEKAGTLELSTPVMPRNHQPAGSKGHGHH
jgi:copper(I)-binding protein